MGKIKNQDVKEVENQYVKRAVKDDVKETAKEDIKRYICIHGHFYQPYRKNPWIEKIEMQEGSLPYHDWNEKITAQCYSANGFAHILNSRNKLEEVVNNYSKISFNFGPTLLEWLKENEIKTYKRILQADLESLRFFSNHGSAIAQTYNHLIMPLADKNDKYLQVYWAIKDFKDKFNREPEGMWLAETAVDYETLEALAEFNIKFTILSPDQAKRFRKITSENEKLKHDWVEVLNGNINTRMPFLCRLSSGKEIVIFFYDKEISIGVSFGDLLNNGEKFANCLINAPSFNQEKPEIIIVASDGETYGHHKKFGDMALAYCLKCIEKNETVKLTVFGEYLSKYAPDYEVEIIENTAWSCPHSLCRWKKDCGCTSDEDNHPDWNQKWRAPLREAISLLRVKINEIFNKEIGSYISYILKNSNLNYDLINCNLENNLKIDLKNNTESDLEDNLKSDSLPGTANIAGSVPVTPLDLLKEYINVINDRSYKNITDFLNKYLKTGDSLKDNIKDVSNNNPDDFEIRKSKFLSLLEMQRQAMLMQSSDGWFFDDICRVESVQILRHACRAIEIAKEFADEDLQGDILKILVNAKSNMDENINGEVIYNKSVIGAIYSPERVAVHLISNLLFNKDIKNNNYNFYSHNIQLLNLKYLQSNNFIVSTGNIIAISKITLKKFSYNFIAVYNKNYFLNNHKREKTLNIYIKELNDNIANKVNKNNKAANTKITDNKAADNKITDESQVNLPGQLDDFIEEIKKILQDENVKNAENDDFLYNYLKKLSYYNYQLYTLNDLNNETQIEFFKILIDGMLSQNAYNTAQSSNAIKNLPDFAGSWINYDFLRNDINNLSLFSNKILIYNLLSEKELNHDDVTKLNNLINLIKDFQNQNKVYVNNYLIEFLDFSKLSFKTGKSLTNLLNLFSNDLKNEELLKDVINLISIFNTLKLNSDNWEIQNILYEIRNKIIKLKNDCKIILSENLIKDFSYLLDYFGVNNNLNT